jgi:hypothetical protein
MAHFSLVIGRRRVIGQCRITDLLVGQWGAER